MTGRQSQNTTSLCFKSQFFQCLIPQQNDQKTVSKHYLPQSSSSQGFSRVLSLNFLPVCYPSTKWLEVSLKHYLPMLQVTVLPMYYPSTKSGSQSQTLPPSFKVTVLPVCYPSTKWLEDSLKTLPPSILFKSRFFQSVIPQLSSSVLSFNKMTGSRSQNTISLCFKSRFFQCIIPQHHDWKSVSKHSLPQSSSTLQVMVLSVTYPSIFFQCVIL